MWPKTLSAMCACWWQGTTADRWDSWNGSFNVLRKVSTVVLNSHALRALRFPRRSVKRKRCRCVRSKRWRRQRRWNTNLIFFNYPAFAHSKISRILIELNWGVTDSLSLSLRYFTKVALLFSKGVQSRSNWGVPRHWGDMHTTVMWLQCELTRLNPNYSARYQIRSKGTMGINIYHI